MLENSLCSFWEQDLSEVWAGTGVVTLESKQQELFSDKARALPRELVRGKGWLADDPEMKAIYPITPEIARQSVPIGALDANGQIIYGEQNVS